MDAYNDGSFHVRKEKAMLLLCDIMILKTVLQHHSVKLIVLSQQSTVLGISPCENRVSASCYLHNITFWHRKLVTDGNDSTSASAQLVRLGVLADRQAQSLTVVERQITKLQLRTRLMGRDVKPLLKTVCTHNAVA